MYDSKQTEVLILGAGPAGLTAAHKLVESNHSVHLVDKCSEVGGLAKTLRHKDILFDIGPHILCNKEYEMRIIQRCMHIFSHLLVMNTMTMKN